MCLQVVHQYLEQRVVTVSDPTLLQSEVMVGSDVAQAQSTEAVPPMAMANSMNEENLTDVLIGVPPEHFFARSASKSSCKTK